MAVKLLTEPYFDFRSSKGGCTCSSESTLVKSHIVGNHMSRLKCYLQWLYYEENFSHGSLTTQLVTLYLRNTRFCVLICVIIDVLLCQLAHLYAERTLNCNLTGFDLVSYEGYSNMNASGFKSFFIDM